MSHVPSASDEIRVLLVDDDALVRAGLSMMLNGAGDLVIVGEAGDGDQVPAAVAKHRPDVVLMDLRMPRVDGITATRRLRRAPQPPEVIVLTTFDADENVLGALRAGASGFLLKDSPPAEIAEAIRRVAAGDPMLSPAVTRRLMRRAVAGEDARQRALRQLEGLSPREREVVGAIAEGLTNAEIAAALLMSVPTVKAHVTHILTKAGLANRTQIALLAHDAGLALAGSPGRPARVALVSGSFMVGSVTGAVVQAHTGPVEPAADSLGRQFQLHAGRRGRARRLRVAGPSDQALHWLAGWYAIALRLGGAALFTAIAVLAATKQISGWWLGLPLAGLCVWSAFFTWR